MKLLASVAFAQGPISKGGSQVNFGVGLSSWGISDYLGFDFGVHPDITLGVEVHRIGRVIKNHIFLKSGRGLGRIKILRTLLK
jgi:hypothetical protein